MRKAILCLALAAIVFGTQISFAQPPGGMPGGGMMGRMGGMGQMGGPMGGGPMGGNPIRDLFTNPEMQTQFRDDMQLTSDQITKLGEAGAEFQRDMGLMFREIGPQLMSADNRMEAIDKLRSEGTKLGDNMKEKMRGMLTEQQYTKLQERTFQMAGGTQGMLFSVGLADTLKLTPEQVKKVEEVQRQMTTEIMQLMGRMQGASADQQAAIRTQIQELVAKYSKMANDILTADQKAKAEKLVAATPEYIKSRLAQNRNQQGGNANTPWRPGPGSWQPGDPIPDRNPGAEDRPNRPQGGRVFPGTQ